MSDGIQTIRASATKAFAYEALESPRTARPAAKALGLFLVILICANAVTVLVPPGSFVDESTPFQVLYLFSTLVFFAEYLARLWIADLVRPELDPARARIKYVLSPMGIVDLFAFLPSMIAWFLPISEALLQTILILRLIRLIKITRYMRGIDTIQRVFTKRRHEIIASFMLLGLLIIVSSVLMYQVEHTAQPETFDSVLTGIYWAITTITTTGYGDIAPITTLGRILGWIVMVLSIAVVAIPGGIFSAGFVAEFSSPSDEEDGETN